MKSSSLDNQGLGTTLPDPGTVRAGISYPFGEREVEGSENCWNFSLPFPPSFLIDESAKKGLEADVAKKTPSVTPRAAVHGGIQQDMA